MTARETKELRCDIDADVMRALDALALTHDQERSKYVAALLDRHVRQEIHKLSLMQSMLHGNPLLSDGERKGGA